MEESFEDSEVTTQGRGSTVMWQSVFIVVVCLLKIAGAAEVGSLVEEKVVAIVEVVGGLSGSDYPNWQCQLRMFFCHFCGSSFSRLLSKTALSLPKISTCHSNCFFVSLSPPC